MKKLALTAAIAMLMALSACSKPVTEVKQGEGHTAAVNAPLSTNNKADIEQDIDTIQNFGMAQEQKATSLQQRMDEAMQKQDQAELKGLFTEFRTFVQNSNKELETLKLKSTEADQLRKKMIENSLIGLEMSEAILTGDMKNVDPAQMQPLQEKAMKAQQELMAISQDIQQKIHPADAAHAPADQQTPAAHQPANTTAPAAQGVQ